MRCVSGDPGGWGKWLCALRAAAAASCCVLRAAAASFCCCCHHQPNLCACMLVARQRHGWWLTAHHVSAPHDLFRCLERIWQLGNKKLRSPLTNVTFSMFKTNVPNLSTNGSTSQSPTVLGLCPLYVDDMPRPRESPRRCRRRSSCSSSSRIGSTGGSQQLTG